MDERRASGWAFETKSSEFLVDLRGGNVWRDGELINCAGLTHDRHFKVLRRLLEKSPATVPYGELLDGIGRDTQAVYDVVNALRRRLGPGVIRNDQRRGYSLEGTTLWRRFLIRGRSPAFRMPPETQLYSHPRRRREVTVRISPGATQGTTRPTRPHRGARQPRPRRSSEANRPGHPENWSPPSLQRNVVTQPRVGTGTRLSAEVQGEGTAHELRRSDL